MVRVRVRMGMVLSRIAGRGRDTVCDAGGNGEMSLGTRLRLALRLMLRLELRLMLRLMLRLSLRLRRSGRNPVQDWMGDATSCLCRVASLMRVKGK